MDAAAAEPLHDGAARVVVAGAKIDFEEFGEGKKRLPFRVIDEIVQSQHVAATAKIAAKLDHLRSGQNGFENFDDDAVAWQQPRSAMLKRGLIDVDEGFGMAGEHLQIEEHHGVHDDTARGFLARLEDVFVASCTKQQLVGEDAQLMIENRLPCDEFLVHDSSSTRTFGRAQPFKAQGKQAVPCTKFW